MSLLKPEFRAGTQHQKIAQRCRVSGVFCLMVFQIIAVIGCTQRPQDTPETGTVRGMVMFDTEFGTDLIVTFQPDSGRPSSGVTNEFGVYELQYSADLKGAKVGHHTVRITRSFDEQFLNPMAKQTATKPTSPEATIPAAYNKNSKLTADVQPGSNEFDFILWSDGK